MPYKISEEDGKWVVKKKDGGKVIGTTTSKEEAEKMIEAIYANDDKDRSLPSFEKLERRFLLPTISEIRSETDEEGKRRIVGLIPFNRLSDDLGGFKERILPTAFANSLNSSNDIFALLNHNSDERLARRSNGSLKLRQTDNGLYVSLNPTTASWGRDALALIDDDLADGLSFGFNIRASNWTKEEDMPVRNLVDVDLREVSLVYDPAYRDGGMVDTRSLNVVSMDIEQEIRASNNPSYLELYKAKQRYYEKM